MLFQRNRLSSDTGVSLDWLIDWLILQYSQSSYPMKLQREHFIIYIIVFDMNKIY